MGRIRNSPGDCKLRHGADDFDCRSPTFLIGDSGASELGVHVLVNHRQCDVFRGDIGRFKVATGHDAERRLVSPVSPAEALVTKDKDPAEVLLEALKGGWVISFEEI